jgi:hypothetical protein
MRKDCLSVCGISDMRPCCRKLLLLSSHCPTLSSVWLKAFPGISVTGCLQTHSNSINRRHILGRTNLTCFTWYIHVPYWTDSHVSTTFPELITRDCISCFALSVWMVVVATVSIIHCGWILRLKALCQNPSFYVQEGLSAHTRWFKINSDDVHDGDGGDCGFYTGAVFSNLNWSIPLRWIGNEKSVSVIQKLFI